MCLQLQNRSSALDLSSEKILYAVVVCYAAIIPKPTYSPFRWLLPFVSTYLCKQEWTLREANDRRSSWSPLFAEIPRAPFEGFALVLASFCEEAYEPLLRATFNKLGRQTYVYQNKAKTMSKCDKVFPRLF